MSETRYIMSFTTGGLFFSESVTVAKLYFDLGDWALVRERVLENNLLQARTVNTAQRVFREISSRLKLLTEDELQLLCNGSRQEQTYLLWIAICKRYAFIRDFAGEVIREKYLRMDLELTYQDYDVFFNAKSEWHEELEQLSDSTKSKLRQVVFRMMREAELLSRNNAITPALLTEKLGQVIAQDSPAWFTVLPVSDTDIKEWAK